MSTPVGGYNGTRLAGNDLARAYGEIRAVNGVSLELQPAEVTVLLGLNGAGKTTLLSMLAGALKPDSGEVKLGDTKLEPTLVGFCTQRTTLWPDLTAREQLTLLGECYGLKKSTLEPRISALLAQLKLSAVEHRQAGSLSGGMQQRLHVALALIHQPPVIILDEPMQGLDPESRRLLRTLIQDTARTREAVVLVSTHDIDEAEHVADRVAIMHEGKLLTLQSKDSLKAQRDGSCVIRLRIPRKEHHLKMLQACREMGHPVSMDEQNLVLRTSQNETTTRWLLEKARELGVKTAGLTVSESSLEDILFAWTKPKDACS